MNRPCDNCTTRMEQAMRFDEVWCFKNYKEWQEWAVSLQKKGLVSPRLVKPSLPTQPT